MSINLNLVIPVQRGEKIEQNVCVFCVNKTNRTFSNYASPCVLPKCEILREANVCMVCFSMNTFFKLPFFLKTFVTDIRPCLAGEECTDIEDPIRDAGKGVWNASRVEFGANGREVSLQQT